MKYIPQVGDKWVSTKDRLVLEITGFNERHLYYKYTSGNGQTYKNDWRISEWEGAMARENRTLIRKSNRCCTL